MEKIEIGALSFDLKAINHYLAVGFLLVLLFMPYQVKWGGMAPQSFFLLLGLIAGSFLFLVNQEWKKAQPDYILIAFVVLVGISVLYHQSFNHYLRAHFLSFASYLWIRSALRPERVDLFVRVILVFLILNVVLIALQLWGSEAWFIARYMTNLDSFRYPLGFYDIPTTAALTPAVLVLFLLSHYLQTGGQRNIWLYVGLFISSTSILMPLSRSSILGFFIGLGVIFILHLKRWRLAIFPLSIIMAGFIITSVILDKSQGELDVANVFEYKIKRPIKGVIELVYKDIKILFPSADFSTVEKKVEKLNISSGPGIDESVFQRLALWKAIGQEMLSEPSVMLKGVGIGNSESAYRAMLASGKFDTMRFGTGSISPHNSVIEFFFETGAIVGFIFLVFLATRLFGYGNWHSPWFASFIFLLIFMMFYDLLRMRYVWVVLALVEVFRPGLIRITRT